MLQLFDVTSGGAMPQINIPAGQVCDLVFSPQNDHIAVVSQNKNAHIRTVSIIRIKDGTLIWQSRKTEAFQVRYLPDGRLANVYRDGRTVDGCTGEERDWLTLDEVKIANDTIWHISVSSDGSLLALVLWSKPRGILMWTTSPEIYVTTLKGHQGPVRHTCFSSDGTLLISGCSDNTVRVWQCFPETLTWSCIAVLYGHWNTVMNVAFLPGDK
jgi:WD40 repeat protein